MSRLLTLPARVLVASLLAVPFAYAETATVQVQDAWARATTSSAMSAGIFLTLTGGSTTDRLVSAVTPVSSIAELHETIDDHGVMKMKEVASVPVAAGESVSLKPGGTHVMLMGLKQQLKPGDSFPVTLVFEKAGTVTTTVTVQSAGAAAPAMAMPHTAADPMSHGTAKP